MKKVFTHENRLIVFHVKNLLGEQGIDCLVKNEFAGGGVGDLSPFESWPELWVDDTQVAEAQNLVENLAKTEPSGETWVCNQCGERNDSSFKLCWNCAMSNRSYDL